MVELPPAKQLADEQQAAAGIFPELISDADWRAPRSQSGYLYGLKGRAGTWVPIAWGSKKQSISADSSGVSELIAAHYSVRAVLGLHSGLYGDDVPLVLRVDNSTVLRIAWTGVSRQLDILETKPISVRLGILKDLRELGVLRVCFVRSAENSADALTKALDLVKLLEAKRMFGLSSQAPPSPLAQGGYSRAVCVWFAVGG